MVEPLPPTENRPLTTGEKTQVLDRVDELLELRYRAKDLPTGDDLLDAVAHAILSRDVTSPSARQFSRDLLLRWGSWDAVRQAPDDVLAEHASNVGLRRTRVRNLQALLAHVHDLTEQVEWHGTTLSWLLYNPSGPKSVKDVAFALNELPHLHTSDGNRIAREVTADTALYEDARATRILAQLKLRNSPEPRSRNGQNETLLTELDPEPVTPRHVNAEALRQNLVHHSRAVCHPTAPLCGHCPLISFCPTGRESAQDSGNPVVVEAFAGGGGLGKGFEDANFDVAIAVELDRDAAQTYRLNHPGTVVVEADATKITGNDLTYLAPRAADVTVIAAGPPCQGYSAAGNRIADDSRNTLYKAVIALSEQLKPRFVVIENVPGIRKVGGESYVDAVLDALDGADYNAAEHLLRACDYGVPQLRRRMIFLAQRKDHGDAPHPPEPTHCPGPTICASCKKSSTGRCTLPAVPSVTETLSAGGLIQLDAGIRAEFLRLDNGAAPITNASTMAHSPEVIAKIATITPGSGPISYRRLHTDLARTIVAGHRALPVHPTLDRTISVREAARIQGFADTHVFAGPRSKQPLQVANAVPPALGNAIAEEIRRILQAADAELSQPEPSDQEPTAPETIERHRVAL